MKRIISVLVSLVICFGYIIPVGAQEALRLTFDEEKELSVVTNTLKNGAEAVFDNGLIGNSLLLNGSYGLYLGEVGAEFSVSAMVKISSVGGTDTIFFKDMDGVGNKWTGVLSNGGKSAFWTHGDGNAWKTVATGSAVLGNWSHVCYVEKNGVGSLYVNGSLIGSGTVATGTGKLYLGATYWSADAPKGLVDDVTLYENALTAEDITDDFAQYIKHMIKVPKEVVADIKLPVEFGTKRVEWTSNDEKVLNSEGKIQRQNEDCTVTLTAMLDGESIGAFEVLVLKKPTEVDRDVILSYKFDNYDSSIVHDKSGNGNHGAAYGDLVITDEGAVFDGADDYIEMPKGVLNGRDNVTIVMKMKPSKSKEHTFAFGFGNGSDAGYIFLNPSRPETNELWFSGTPSDYREERAITSIPGLRRNEWATVCVAINEKSAEMYVDGDLVMSGYMGVAISELGETDKNYIAKSLYDGDPYFGGIVEEFTIYGYTMDREDMEVYKKAEEYAPLNEEEYITNVSFEGGIDVTVDTFGRDDVKIGAVVLDENNEIIEFAVVNADEAVVLEKSGTVCVFAFNTEDNTPGRIYVSGTGEGFSYEYTPGKVTIVSEVEKKNGTIIVAGYDISGTLTGVGLKIGSAAIGERIEINGDFDNAVKFKLLYWSDVVSMLPLE